MRVQLEQEREETYARERQARAEAEEARRQADADRQRLRILVAATASLGATLDVPTVLLRLARLTVPGVADWSAVDVMEEGAIVRTAIVHRDPEKAELLRRAEALQPRHELAGSAAGRVLAGGEPTLIVRLPNDYIATVSKDPEQRALYEALESRSAIVVPLRARRQMLGVLTLVRTADSGRLFNDADFQLAKDLAGKAALAIDNARLYTREHQVAEALQRSLLPVVPHVPGLTIAPRYLPGSVDVEVGGDWYDVLVLPDGAVGLVIGDVMGHDLAAAAAMGQLRSVLRSYAWEGDEPAVVLDRVDRLVQGLAVAQLATAVYARFQRDADGGVLRYANAGHLPPLLQESDGTVRYLEGGRSVLLGAPFGEDRPDAVERLAVGATLLLFTDGLIERRSASLDHGLDWLRAIAQQHAPEDGPDALCDRVLGSLAGQDLSDDAALLAVRVLPAPGE